MADYSVTFARSARKELEALSNSLIIRIFSKIEALSIEPRPDGCRKLQGFTNLWRIRIGDYRVVYSIDDNNETIDIIAVRHRRKAYE
ncbi:MAG TPA: type II toxin-antitoxin system RelE/ParE family toxin [Pyrinomonadaceae bacterium]|jgi:mRNA interferase RelE/StbE